MKLKRIKNRPLRLLLFIPCIPLLIWECIDFYFDIDGFVDFIKSVWRE